MKRTGKRFTIEMQDKVKKKKSAILPGLIWQGINRISDLSSFKTKFPLPIRITKMVELSKLKLLY